MGDPGLETKQGLGQALRSAARGAPLRLTGPGHVVSLFAVALAYLLSAKVGLLFAFQTRQVTAVWPPTGIAIVAYALLGFRVWPGVFVGAFLANVAMSHPATAAGIAVGNTLAGVVGLVLARRTADFRPNLGRARDVLALSILGGAVGSVVSASNGVGQLVLAGSVPLSNLAPVWWVWWVGDSLGVVLFAPVLLTWVATPSVGWPWGRLVEGVAASLLGVIVCALFVLGGATDIRYVAFPLLVWAGLRFGMRETATLAVLLAGFASWGAVHDRGPFVGGTPDERLVQLDVFLAILSVTALLIGAVISERRVADARYHRLFDSGMIGIVISDASGRVIEANDMFLKMVRYDRADLEAGRLNASVLNVPDAGEAHALAREQLETRGVAEPWEKEFVRKDGSRVPALNAVAYLEPPTCINVVMDMTVKRRAEELTHALEAQRATAEQLRDQTMTDELTQLLNRRGFLLLANAQLEAARSKKAPTALLYADVNGLKRINDDLGHAQGDRVIEDAARILRRVLRDRDLVARLGGDEFAALLPNFAATAQGALLERIASTIRAHEKEDRPFRLSMSYGLTLVDWERTQSLDDLLADADQRMYERKRERANTSLPYLRVAPRITTKD